MQKAHRAREPDLARAHAQHLAAHAAQFRERLAAPPSRGSRRRLRRAERLAIDAEAHLAAPRAKRSASAQGTARDRDGLRRRRRAPCGSARRDPARARRCALRPTRSCPDVRAAKRSISPASRGGATTSVPSRTTPGTRASHQSIAPGRDRPRFAARSRPRRTARACRPRAMTRCRRARATARRA